MEIIRSARIEGTLEELLQQFQPGDNLLLYEGKLNDWRPHPQGVVIRIGNRFLLNGEEVLYEREWDDWRPHPQGVVIRIGNHLLLFPSKKED